MRGIEKILVFSLSGLLCALPLPEVERILQAVEIISVPKAPLFVMGLINIQGRVVPVLNIRKLFNLPFTRMTMNDRIIITRAAGHAVAIIVDNVLSVGECREQDIIAPEELFPGFESLEGVTKQKSGMILIYNLDGFLRPEEKAGILLSVPGDEKKE